MILRALSSLSSPVTSVRTLSNCGEMTSAMRRSPLFVAPQYGKSSTWTSYTTLRPRHLRVLFPRSYVRTNGFLLPAMHNVGIDTALRSPDGHCTNLLWSDSGL